MRPGEFNGQLLPIADDPIRFKTADEFRDRPRYVSKLDPVLHELEEIVGGYGFAKSDELKCGFCGVWHQHGFVIRTRSGDETNLGQDCGRKYFGARWDELYALFKERDEAREQREFIESTLREKPALIELARALRVRLGGRLDSINAVVGELSREQPLFSAAVAVERRGGSVRVQRRIAKDSYAGSSLSEEQRSYLETVAHIEGIDVLGLLRGRRPCVDYIEGLREAVVTIEGWDAAALSRCSPAQRRTTVKQIEKVKTDLADAQRHAEMIDRFLDPTNIKNFAKMDVGQRMNNRTKSIMARFEAGYVKPQK